ncbi:hypothetical protein H5410_062606 [Solanum commersonii]|uniref:Uncharacterized protein n=1 Tax=Solanum commersonii TaxID=4109 RepID=A0A9J5WCU4_SOLCO|nr:hypothetical protein H5410_062606 [Solanum commersonii]
MKLCVVGKSEERLRAKIREWERVLAIKNSHLQKMHVVEGRMLRWIYDHTRRDNITNDDI